MKLVKCILPPAKLEAVKQALLREGVQGMTVYDVRGFGIHQSQLKQKTSRNYGVEFQPRIMLEVVITDKKVDKVLRIITTTGKTGRLGDGKLFVLPVDEAVRIRTSERGEAAL